LPAEALSPPHLRRPKSLDGGAKLSFTRQ
jgi:hypothetical protein